MEPKPNPSPSEDHGMTRQIDGPDSISQNESSNETIHAGFWSPSTARFPVVCIWDVGRRGCPVTDVNPDIEPEDRYGFCRDSSLAPGTPHTIAWDLIELHFDACA